ncbi:hypothetical protein C3747_17g609 [Trypanosoma cruzi]|uniref:EF-hand domain-containing protein n=2 Tax=Trypanosoma cruzi TaxID=5693 RepID=Q4DNS4_TRYCC|nr:hypothetical protein, conserved [Trypanosoma cruzi]EAN94155.1 hypothetical protein, conserved [Trypanosoma cruzi]PWV17612.1 hypothetical protein C3747_17g609 [Trypanosoma cruzi]|eukprot:XP_816006.1 hypothetical protein [Trypanosoma cruzi strain CL Brener]
MDAEGIPMRYSPGVLIGNWYEEMRVREDKVTFYRSSYQTDKTHWGATLNLSEETYLDGLKDFVLLGQSLQLVNVATEAALALDMAPKFSPKPNHYLVTAVDTPQPQVRSTWVLHRAKDENNIAYTKQLKEENVLHYGQHVRIANEEASLDGFCYLNSGVLDIGHPGKQPLTAVLGANKDNVFVIVKPGEKRDDIRDGGPVRLGDAVALFHASTNRPICCTKSLKNTSFGYEFEVSCAFSGNKHSRSLAAVALHPENLFIIGGSTHKARTNIPASVNTSLKSSSGLSNKMLSMSSGIGLELIMARIREGSLRFGGRLGFRTLSKALGTACNEQRTTLLNREQIHHSIRLMGVAIQPMELDAIFKRFDRDGNGLIVAQQLLRELRGELPPHRLDAVICAFQLLTIEGGGSVEYKDMLNLFKFNVFLQPDVEEGVISCEEAIFDFINCWPGKNDTSTVTLEDFVAYYTDVSPAIENDERFVTTVQRSWTIPETDAYRSGRPRRHVTVIHTDDTAETIEIPDSLVLNLHDFVAVRDVLLQHGVKDIKEIQTNM